MKVLKIFNIFKYLVLFLIKIYQRVFSVDQGFLRYLFPNTRVCIFTPTCSEYTYQAVNKYGILKGLFLGLKRILRCGPWSEGGYDPVP